MSKKVDESRRLELSSEPPGADVLTGSGENLGVTPLVLEKEQLSRVTRAGQVELVISAPGYIQREVLLDLHGKDSHQIQLLPYEKNYFSERLIQDFPQQANSMARGLVEIQSLVFARKLNEAEKALESFRKAFPNIAATYVLSASVESLRGNQAKARRYLLRARTLDPLDPVAARMLNDKTMGARNVAGQSVLATSARAPASAPRSKAKPKQKSPAAAPPTAPVQKTGGGQ